MSNKESLKHFRRKSQFFENNIKSFPGRLGTVSLKQQHEQELEQLMAGGSSDEDEDDRGWGPKHLDDVEYSDTDSSGDESGSDSELSDEAEARERQSRVQEKLRATQRRFATIFSAQGPQTPTPLNPRQAILAKQKKEAAERCQLPPRRPQNLLVPPSVLEEDFRHRSRGRIQHENYFGAEAKSSFIQRVQWVAREQSVLDPPRRPYSASNLASAKSEYLTQHTVFEDNTLENSHTIDFPFMPRRPAALNSEDEGQSLTTEELELEMSAVEQKSSVQHDDSVSLLFCDDFDLPAADLELSQQQPPPNLSVAEETYDTHSVATLDLSATMQFHKQTEATPRTRFIASCLQAKVHPRSSLLLRKNVSTDLNLQHQGMGDTMAGVLAKSLPDLPFVHSLDLTDNNLSGAGLQPIIQALAQLPSLTKLTLSQNIINRDSAIALASYVSQTPILCELVLSKADVDDYECTMFVAALTDNLALSKLDLSHNSIGTSELLNTVLPDTTTGAEALADFLSSSHCRMTTLLLQWNQIRLDGALALAEALEVNTTLTHLDLSYNALGPSAGEVLGHSLLSNCTLKTLNIANNNINSSACFTICVGLMDNYCLETLILDSNPIGEFGARMVMQMPLEVGTRIDISAKGCNLSQHNPNDDMYKHDSPAGSYELKLEQPYQRAICLRILRLLAVSTNFKFTSFAHQKPLKARVKAAVPSRLTGSSSTKATNGAKPPTGKGKKVRKGSNAVNVPPRPNTKQIKLVLSHSSDKLDHLDDATSALLHNLYKIEKAAGNVELAELLFNEYDDDGNGSLDVDEIRRLLANIGINFDLPTLSQAIEMFDVDGAGTLELNEFLQFLRAQREEARGRIRELTYHPIMAAAKMTSIQYIPPKVGTMFIEIEDSFSSKGTEVVMSTDIHNRILNMVEGGTTTRAKILAFSIQHAKIHLQEALQIFRTMQKEVKDPAVIVQQLLPRMASATDAKQLLLTSLSDVGALNRLRKLMGSSLNPMIGQFNGYYLLDLVKVEDRVCLSKLLEQNQKQAQERMDGSLLGRGRTGDISQKGDWSCFRNELRDGQPVQLTTAMFNPMPHKGIYRFDFSGADRPPRKTAPMSDERCLNVLVNLELLTLGKRPSAESALAEMRRKCVDNNPGVGNFTPVISTREQAEEIQFYMLRFYSQLHTRHEQFRTAQDNEGLKTTVVDTPSKRVLKEKERERKRRDKTYDYDSLSSSSSSDDDEKDYYDHHEAINFVPLFGAPSPDSNIPGRFSPKRNNRRQFADIKEEEEEEDSSDNDDTSADSSTVSSTGTRTSEEDEITDAVIGGKVLSLRQLQQQQKPPSPTKGGGRQTLLAQLETTFDDARGEGRDSGRGVMKGVRGSRLHHRGQEAQDEDGMLAARTARPERRRVLNKGMGLTAAERKCIDEHHKQSINAPKKLRIHPQAKAAKTLSSLMDVFQRVWIRSRHLAYIMQAFSDGAIVRMPDFGSYRVEVVVALFCRVVDVQHFDLVWEKLRPQEIACIYCRLGILNFFNPLKLEGCYSLDISRYEERMVAKILAALSTVEPGENWINESFRWEYFAECIPGWELTKSWMKDENMPHRGYLYLEYYSGGCTKFGVPLMKAGCKPDLLFRKSLLALVYINEDSIIDDECNKGEGKEGKFHKRLLRVSKDGKRVKSESAGAGYIKDFVEYYNALLAPVNTPSTKIANGEPTEQVFEKVKHSIMNVVKNLPQITDVYFGGGDMVIDKSSEKGKKMMERLQERVLKRNRDAKEQQEKTDRGAKTPAAALSRDNDVSSMTAIGGKKKPMDLSVDTSVFKPPSSSSSSSARKVSAMDKMMSEVALHSATSELASLTQKDQAKLTKRKLKLDRKAKERVRKNSVQRKRIVDRSDSMITVQGEDRSALVSKIKKDRGHIDRGK